MSRTRDELLKENKQCRERYPRIYDELLALLFRHDPIGINFETNFDEYSPEVRTILPRLVDSNSTNDVLRVVYEEFTDWFGDAGPRQRYEEMAPEIWELWRRYQAQQDANGEIANHGN